MTKIAFHSRPFEVQIELLFVFDDADVHQIARELVSVPKIVRSKGELHKEKNLPPFGKISFYSHANRWDSPFDEHEQSIFDIDSNDIDYLLSLSKSASVIIILNHCGDLPYVKLSKRLTGLAGKLGGGFEFFHYNDLNPEIEGEDKG